MSYFISAPIAAISAFFAVICVKNLYQGNVLSHASCTSKLHLALVFLQVISLLTMAITLTVKLSLICDKAVSMSGAHYSCPDSWGVFQSHWCSSCPDLSVLYDGAVRSRNSAWAACAMILVIAVLATIRHVRAAKEEAKQEAEAAEKRRVAEEEAAAMAKKHTGEGKGFVYKMLL